MNKAELVSTLFFFIKKPRPVDEERKLKIGNYW